MANVTNVCCDWHCKYRPIKKNTIMAKAAEYREISAAAFLQTLLRRRNRQRNFSKSRALVNRAVDFCVGISQKVKFS